MRIFHIFYDEKGKIKYFTKEKNITHKLMKRIKISNFFIIKIE